MEETKIFNSNFSLILKNNQFSYFFNLVTELLPIFETTPSQMFRFFSLFLGDDLITSVMFVL